MASPVQESNKLLLYILIPAFNESISIYQVIATLKDKGYPNILVVNDGSTDNTAKIASQAGAEVLDLIMNRGQGAALKAGIDYLKHISPDIIITFDADGQHHPEDIPLLIQPILDHKANIVLGSRFLKPNLSIPPLRKFVLKAGIIFTCIASDIIVSDTHNGLRALDRTAYNRIRIKQRGMEHASEIIDEIKRQKLRYKEAPVTITYTDYSRTKGQSSSNFIKIGLKFLIRKISS